MRTRRDRADRNLDLHRHRGRGLDTPLSFYLLHAYGHGLQAAYFVLAGALCSLGAG